MTLIELIIAMIVVSVGVGGILIVFTTTTRDSAEPLVQKQMVAIAEGMLEEIQRMPYAVTPPNPPAGCIVRSAHNDLLDYNGYDCADATDVQGNLQLRGYRVQVAVVPDASPQFADIAGNVLKITVTVTTGGKSISLVGWRTNYARLIP